MPLTLDITSAWEATNDAGGALASALHAIRTDAIDTPVILRRPAQRFSEKDRLGEALLLVAESKRHAAAALRRIEAVESTIQQQLATR
jgi:hypothetical protein